MFYPAMGGLLLSGYFLLKDYYPFYYSKVIKTSRIEFAVLVRDKVIPLSLINRTSFDEWGRELAGYRINDFNQNFLKDVHTKPSLDNKVNILSTPTNEEYRDMMEFTILEYLSQHFGFFSSFSDSESTKFQGGEIVKINDENFFLKFDQLKLQAIKERNGFVTRNPEAPYSKSIPDWKIPGLTKYKVIKENQFFRRHRFSNKKWTFEIHLSGFGGSLFHPESIRFHQHMTGYDSFSTSMNTELKKMYITLIFEKRSRFRYSDSYDKEVEYIENLFNAFEKDFSWINLKNRLREEYLTQTQ